MPLYLCLTDARSIPEITREGIAKKFTEIHCSLTFAPPSFVHVYFIETGPVTDGGPEFTIMGNIRADRTEAVKENIIEQMCSSVSSTLSMDREKISMTISESPGRWTMEGGHLLPEPGEEDAWMERHNAMIAEQGS